MSDVDIVRETLQHLHSVNGWRTAENRQGIDDATARVIASWWCSGNDTDAAAFVSTGAVPYDSSALWFTFVPDFNALHSDDQLAAEYLGTYLIHHAGRGPVPGWTDLSVRASSPTGRS